MLDQAPPALSVLQQGKMCNSRRLFSVLPSFTKRALNKKVAPDSCTTASTKVSSTRNLIRTRQHAPSKRVSVRFSSTVKVHRARAWYSLSGNDIKSCWYTRKERAEMQRQAQMCAIQSITHDRRFQKSLGDTYETALYVGLVATSEKYVSDKLNDKVAMAKYVRVLRHWGFDSHHQTCRGLESWMLTSRQRHKGRPANEARAMVLEMITFSSAVSVGSGRRRRSARPQRMSPDSLAKVYEEAARPFLILARIYGEADSLAASRTFKPEFSCVWFGRAFRQICE